MSRLRLHFFNDQADPERAFVHSTIQQNCPKVFQPAEARYPVRACRGTSSSPAAAWPGWGSDRPGTACSRMTGREKKAAAYRALLRPVRNARERRGGSDRRTSARDSRAGVGLVPVSGSVARQARLPCEAPLIPLLATLATYSNRHSEPARVRSPRRFRSDAMARSDLPRRRASRILRRTACSAGSGSICCRSLATR